MSGWSIFHLLVVASALLGLFFWLLIRKKKDFDATMLGLLSLPILIVVIAILQPKSIKAFDVELNDLHDEVKEVIRTGKENNQKVESTVLEVQRALKLALETTAMVTWNTARSSPQEEKAKIQADEILRQLYGEDAKKYREYMQREGIYFATPQERIEVQGVAKPASVESPLLNTLQLKIQKLNDSDLIKKKK